MTPDDVRAAAEQLVQSHGHFASLADTADLRGLPLRADVAYAVRCAGRIRPLLTTDDAALDRALTLAGAIANGGVIPRAELDTVARSAERVVAPGAWDAWSYSAAAVAAAARCAGRAVAADPPGVRAAAAAAARASRWACGAAIAVAFGSGRARDDASVRYAGAAQDAAAADAAALSQLGLGRYPELGSSVDPSALGPLWPGGWTPFWFPPPGGPT